MLVLIQNLSYYMMVEVIEPAWHSLVVSLSSCTTVDDVLEKHNDFLDNCLHDCLLSSPQVRFFRGVATGLKEAEDL